MEQEKEFTVVLRNGVVGIMFIGLFIIGLVVGHETTDKGPSFIRDDEDPTWSFAARRTSPDTISYYGRHNVYSPK